MDPEYLRYQYSTANKLRIRAETHKRYTEWPPGTPPGDPFADGLVQHLALRPGLTLLDGGCGPGDVHTTLCTEGDMRIAGVDTSLGMLVTARQHGQRAYVQADAECLPIADESFNRVMANHMLYHAHVRIE